MFIINIVCVLLFISSVYYLYGFMMDEHFHSYILSGQSEKCAFSDYFQNNAVYWEKNAKWIYFSHRKYLSPEWTLGDPKTGKLPESFFTEKHLRERNALWQGILTCYEIVCDKATQEGIHNYIYGGLAANRFNEYEIEQLKKKLQSVSEKHNNEYAELLQYLNESSTKNQNIETDKK